MEGKRSCSPSSGPETLVKRPKLDAETARVQAKSGKKFVDVGEKEEALPICESSLDSSTVRAQDLLDGEGGDEVEKAKSVKEGSEKQSTTASGPRYMSVDVECVATGRRHDDREVCFVSVVDWDENVLLSKKVKPESPVVSYLTPLTGVRKGDLDDGAKLSDVKAQVKSLLGRDVVLIGQGVKSDIDWLELRQGQDYADTKDLGEFFKTYNQRYQNYSFFSLSHEANTLIRQGFISEPHDPDIDAIASIKLFKMYHDKPRELEQAKKKLISVRPPPSFGKKNNYRYEGVCLAAFYEAKCFCGAPTKAS